MHQALETIVVPTTGGGLYEFTGRLRDFVTRSDVRLGLVTAYVRHTSCSLVVQENADPDVQKDLLGFFRRLVPEGMEWLAHTAEGPDDMPAHIKAALTQTSISIPVSDGGPVLGTWQGVYLFEHRQRPHRREVVLHIMGEA
jgi:secondary thiamine-phosphate synthase enzyme